MGKLLNLGSILSVIGIAYVAHTVYTFYNIYFPPWCSSKSPQQCISPKFLCEKSDLVIQAFLSQSPNPPDKGPKSGSSLVFSGEKPCGTAWEETFTVGFRELPSNSAVFYLHVLALAKAKGKKLEVDMLRSDSPNVVYQRSMATRMMAEEKTAMNLIQSATNFSGNASASTGSRSFEFSNPLLYMGLCGEKILTVQRAVVALHSYSHRSHEKILHWHSKLRLSVMETPITFDRQSVPQEVHQYLKLKQESGNVLKYLPLLFIDSLSPKKDEYIPLRSEHLNLTIEYTPISIGKIRIIAMISGSMEQLKSFGLQESDLEDVIAIFTETNFYILAFTIMVTVLHLVFDFLAFKNDINYWRKRDNVVGLSGRTILWRAFSQIIVFLYLLEEKSSLLITVPAGLACFIEAWKVLKLWKFQGIERNGWRIRLKFKATTAAEQNCDDIDAGFMRKLFYLLLPLCLGGAIYSLYYVPHKSWYSWTVQSAVNGVYAFGFLFMIPQLYMNYRLKSVAHLPWKVFSYKALNTFIDDLFAFIVKMPLAHRLACFRDDIIFVLYLVQWYMYPVDKSRANEFGQSFEDEAIEKETARKALAAGDGAEAKETKKNK